jgi:hypothetical protein
MAELTTIQGTFSGPSATSANKNVASYFGVPRIGTTIGEQQLADLIATTFAGKFVGDCSRPFITDGAYVCVEDDLMMEIADAARKRCGIYIPHRFDCEDYAYVLRAEISLHTFIEPDPESPGAFTTYALCGGVIFANFGPTYGDHARVWYVRPDGTIGLIEPRIPSKHDPSECRGDLKFMFV